MGRFWSTVLGCIAGVIFIEIAGPTTASIVTSKHLLPIGVSIGEPRAALMLIWLYLTGILVGVAVAGALGGKKPRAGKAATGAVLFTVAVWSLVFFAKTEAFPSELAGIRDTHWRGHIGRAPAALDIFQEASGSSLSGRISYEGIAEDLTVARRADGGLVLQGRAYRRESGTGPFALDTFYGTVSSDGRGIRGTLLDGARRRGEWGVSKIIAGADLANDTIRSLFPTQTSTTQWRGIVGKWPAIMEIMPPSTTGEWRGHVTYRNVREELTISVKQDGSVVLAGTGYEYLSGEGAFSLDTFYGQLSADGQRLQGLRIDAAQSRGPWSVTRVGTGGLAAEAQSDQPLTQPSFDCGKALKTTEIEICSDHNLATLEADMANAYYQVLDQLDQSEKADFRRAHFDWFKRYQNTCNVEEPGSQNLKNCIFREMVQHTNELKSRLNSNTEISQQER